MEKLRRFFESKVNKPCNTKKGVYIMVVKGDTSKIDTGYVAPVTGNGNVSFQVDYEGTMQYAHSVNNESDTIKFNPNMRIWWAGRRYIVGDNLKLIPFGMFEQEITHDNVKLKADNYTQEIDTDNGIIKSQCKYDNEIEISSEVFVTTGTNIIAVHKKSNKTVAYKFIYRFCGMDFDTIPAFTNCEFIINKDNTADIKYKIDAGLFPYRGIIRLYSDCECRCQIKNNKVIFDTIIDSDSECTFYIQFTDSVNCDDFETASAKTKEITIKSGYQRIVISHSNEWQNYNKEGYAVICNEHIDEIYKTAQYHLKCFTTDWSIPVGLSDTLWNGRYFAFDEFYMFMGLISSGHISAAKHIPDFRFKGLGEAIRRGNGGHEKNMLCANYPWETVENYKEGMEYGFWNAHIFHLACISCGEYYYYKFTNDKQFLKEKAYPVVKACANFYVRNSVYHVAGGRTIIGKCTDLERMGSYVENAYMTTCGVIKTFNILAEMSDVLNVDKEFANECRVLSSELYRDLPNDGKKYIPYYECKETSIGLLSGTYPFDVIENDNLMQDEGIKSYLESESNVGNMYAVGTGVCSWYMTWKALVFARLGKKVKAHEAVLNAAHNSGKFAEMFEIYDAVTPVYFRPWFTTAAGMLVHSVNELLLQNKNEKIYIAPAMPENENNFSFKLAAMGDFRINVECSNGVITKFNIEFGANFDENNIYVVLPKHLKLGDVNLPDNVIVEYE